MEVLNLQNHFSHVTLRKLLIVILFLSLGAFVEKAQAQTEYKIQANSQVKVAGSSNLHDWTMAASNFVCTGTFIVKNQQLQEVTGLSFILPVKNLKSNEDLMNTRAYKALKTDKITFLLTDATVVQQPKIIKVNGNLLIGGTTKPVSLQVNYTVNADGVITCTGSKKIKMSEFNIAPPTFMLGALKVADEVNIILTLNLK